MTAVFVGNGVAFGAWAASIPRVREASGLTDGALGLLLLCVSLGAVAAMQLAGRYAGRIGTARACSLAAPLLAVALPGPALAPSWPWLLASGLALGLGLGLLDVCMNAHAAWLERRRGRPIMSSFHAGWSLGQLVGAAGAGALAAAGLGVVPGLAIPGAAVALWDLDAAAMATTASELSAHGTVSTHPVELTNEQAVRAAAEATLARHGAVDILVNNAGITGGNAPAWDLPAAEWRRVIEVNLVGPYLACAAVLPGMVARGYGRVVNIASVAGKEGNPNASHYSASKAGLIGLTKSLGKELAGKGVLVNCITPAAAETELFQQMRPEQIAYMRSKIPMDRFVDVREIAAMACWLATEDCSFSTGAVFDISGGRATY